MGWFSVALIIASFFIRGSKPRKRNTSPTYKFGPWDNTSERDIPVPIIYGKNKVAGNLIYRTPEERKEIIQFIGLGEGEIKSVSDIKVNDVPIDELEDCSYDVYLGTATQEPDSRQEKRHLIPVADTYVDSRYPDSSEGPNRIFGNFFKVLVSDGLYEGYMKFDLSQLRGVGEIISATLYLRNGRSDNSGTCYVYKVADDSWEETELTWNTRPPMGDQIGSVYFHKDSRAWETLDVTNYLKEEFVTSDQLMSLGFREVGGDRLYFYSKDSSSLPYIEVIYTPVGVGAMRHTAYIASTIKAQEKVSGGTPTITCIVEGLKVPPIGGGTRTYSRNPARCIYDLLTNSRYGLGYDPSVIDTTSFSEVEAYCDELVPDGAGGTEPRFQLDIVLDEKEPALDALNDILATFGGYLYYSNGKLKLGVERAKSPVQSFDMDTIVEGSFSYEEVPLENLPNRVKVLYTDENEDFNQTHVVAEDRISIEDEGEVREEEIALYGINRRSQASRMAMQYLWKARLCRTTCSFRVGIGALKCEVGDVIEVSHDVPGWAGKQFMIEKMQMTENDEMELFCREYNASIYNDEGLPYQDDEGTVLPNPLEAPDHVRNLTLEESGFVNQDGIFVPRVLVSFDEPFENAFWHHAEIWTSLDGENWTYYGNCQDGNKYPIVGVFQIGDTLYVKAVSVSVYGVKADFDTAPYESEEISETMESPPDVTGLQVEGMGNELVFYGRDCKFVWNRVSATTGADQTPVGNETFGAAEGTDDPYFKDYYLEIWVGGSKVRSEIVTDNWYIYTFEKNVEDNNGIPQPTFTIKVWARNNYNLLSQNPATLTVSNPSPDSVSGLSAIAGRMRVKLSWTNPTGVVNEDIESILIYRNTSNSIPSSPFVELAKDTNLWIDTDVSVGQKYYYWVKVKDAFGQLSSAAGSVSATPTGLEMADYDLSTHLIQDLDFSNNSPSSGYVSWTQCKIAYKGSVYTISSGYTNKKYIWWDKTYPTIFQTSDTKPTLVVGEDLLVCYNDGGTANPVFQRMLLFGALIQANTILSDNIAANQIKAGHIAFDLDDVPDGGTYGRVLKADISAGHILLSETIGNLDDISDGSTYGSVRKTDISGGHILLSETIGDLDDIADGTNYAKVSSTDISAGRIQLNYDDGKMVLGKDTFGPELEGIKINDGTNDRVKIGEIASGTYGIQLFDASGNKIFDAAGSGTPDIAGWDIEVGRLASSGGEIVLDSANKKITLGPTPTIEIDGVSEKILVGSATPKIEIDGINKIIQSTNFQEGAAGFKIQATGDAEFNDITARGKIKAAVFEYRKISVVGGHLAVCNGSVLAEDITDTETDIDVEEGAAFAVNDVARIGDGVSGYELVEVTAINGNTLTVTRGYNGTTPQAFTKGTPVFVWDKRIEIDGPSNYLKVFDGSSTRVWLGDLGAIGSPATIGGYGLWSDNVELTGKIVASSGSITGNLDVTGKLRTAASGARIEIDGSSTPDEIKAFNSSSVQTVSIKGDGSGFFGVGDGRISWDTAGNVSLQGTLSALSANMGTITAGLLKSQDGKTQFDLDNSYIIAIHPDNPDMRVKFFGRGICVSSDGGSSWQNVIVYDSEAGRMGFDASSAAVGQLDGKLLDLDHLYAYDASGQTLESSNTTQYSTTSTSYVEKGSTDLLTVDGAQSNIKVTVQSRCSPFGVYAYVKLVLCDVNDDVKDSVVFANGDSDWHTFSKNWDLSQWFSDGEQYRMRRYLRVGIQTGGDYAYTRNLYVYKIGELYPLIYK